MRRLVEEDVESKILARIGTDFNLAPVKIQLAGRLVVKYDHVMVDEQLLYGRQSRLIFAMLVIERDRPVHRDELAELLWPYGLPRTWEAALRSVVSKVRAFLGAAGLPQGAKSFGRSGTYQLQLPPGVVLDVESAGFAVEAAQRYLHEGDSVRAIVLAEYARKVATRPFLLGATGRWVDSVRDRLSQVCLWALCVLSEGYAQRGWYQLAVRTATDAIAIEPFRERTHQLLMRAHSAAGNPAEALRVYDRCRRLLAEELGITPTVETSALHLALLQSNNE
ncbi:MAG: AfsR/SARP family transcriptional regulator [Pseudonocardiaceae bacterium]